VNSRGKRQTIREGYTVFWEGMHPGGYGGYYLWAIPAGAPKR